MKKYLMLLLIYLFSFVHVSAQVENSNVNEIFLLTNFENGVVNFNSGRSTKARLNYGAIKQQMYFMGKDTSILTLTNTADISTVNIAGRVFEHLKNGQFYERITIGESFMYIDWKTKVIMAKMGAYGSEDHSSAITNLNSFSSKDGQLNVLEIGEKIKTISQNRYFVKINGKFRKFSSFRDIAKIFKVDAFVIDSYVKEEELNFKNIEDIKKGLEYAVKMVSSE